jgi:hypothetical protein
MKNIPLPPIILLFVGLACIIAIATHNAAPNPGPAGIEARAGRAIAVNTRARESLLRAKERAELNGAMFADTVGGRMYFKGQADAYQAAMAMLEPAE